MSIPSLTVADIDRPEIATTRVNHTKNLKRIAYVISGSAIAFLFLFPVFWSVLTSFKPAAEASASPPTFWPSRISLENYVSLSQFGAGIGKYLWNSAYVSSVTVAGVLVLSISAGYGFSRFRFPGKNVLFIVILATMMIPYQSILTPLFILLNAIGLQDTLTGLSLVYITFQLPFSIFMMRNSFDAVPRELEEAATLDGCSPMAVLLKIMLPVVFPGIVTVGLFAFFTAWNELLVALILVSNPEKFTLPVLLQSAQSQFLGGIDWGVMQAGISLSILPCGLLFALLQRFYINGLIAGAVKA